MSQAGRMRLAGQKEMVLKVSRPGQMSQAGKMGLAGKTIVRRTMNVQQVPDM
jgi:hypothetical protein